MDFITTKEAAEKWGISPTRITVLANQGRIAGAQRVGRSWLIPAGASKPIDRRTSHAESRAEEADTDNFSFSLYIYRPDWSPDKEAALSKPEKKLLQAERALLECRFKEAYALLESVLLAPGDIGTEISALGIACLCCIALNRVGDFSRMFLRLQMLLSGDFPHRKDYAIVLDLVKTYVDTVSNAAKANTFDTDIHYQCLPMLSALLGYTNLSREFTELGSADTALTETLLRFLQSTASYVAVENMHLYLLGIYYHRQDLLSAERHARAALQIAFKNSCYFPLVTFYRVFSPVIAPVLEQYPPTFQENLRSAVTQFVQNYTSLTSALNADSVFSELADGDFPYIGAVLQDMPNKIIAVTLGVSEHTVKRKLNELCAKLNVSTKKELRNYLLKYM